MPLGLVVVLLRQTFIFPTHSCIVIADETELSAVDTSNWCRKWVEVSSKISSAKERVPRNMSSASGVEAVQSTALLNGGTVGNVPWAWPKCNRFLQRRACRISTGSVNTAQEVHSLQWLADKSPSDGISRVVRRQTHIGWRIEMTKLSPHFFSLFRYHDISDFG
jgi:hypothetical protein